MKRNARIRLKNRGFAWTLALCALALLVALNLGLERLDDAAYLRLDLSPDRVTALSESSRAALAALTEPVAFTVARSAGATDELSRLLDELLEKYISESPMVTVETLDPELEPLRVSALDPGGAAVEDNTVFVTLGGRTRRVNGDQFLYQRTLDGQAYRLFCGDARLSGVLRALQSGETKRAVFLTGHGEKTSDDCRTFALALASAGFEVVSGGADAPTGADTLIVLAPQTDLTLGETKALAAFLDGGGAMLIACGSETSLGTRFATLLDLYGLAYASGAVVESAEESDRYIDLPDRLCPLTTDAALCESIRQRLILPRSCALAAPRPLGDRSYEVLLTTSERAYRKASGNQSLYAFEPGDVSGAQTLALASEGAGPRVVQLASVTMLLDDGAIAGAGVLDASGNLDFLTDCAVWLSGGETAYASADLKVLPNSALTFDSESQRERVVLWSVAALPAAIALIGLCALLWRRRRVR